MDTSVIKSYLVKLGFEIDNPKLAQFNDALRRAAEHADSLTSGFAKAGASVVAAMTSISAGTLLLMNRTAQADLGYQVFARQMFMTADAAKKMKIATDALGYSLEDIIWGPPELQNQFRDLMKFQDRLQANLGGKDFESEMQKIRRISLEFTKMEIAGQYFAMSLTKSLSKALGGDEDWLYRKLRDLNDYLVANIPHIADIVATQLVPVLRDTWAILQDIGAGAKGLLSLFVGFTGVVANIDKLKSGEVTVASLATAFERWATAVRNIVDGIRWLVSALVPMESGAPGTYKGFWGAEGKPGSFGELGKRMLPKDYKEKMRALGATVGANLGLPSGLLDSLMFTESRFNPNATSSKGAMGLTQLMPGTAKSLGVTDPYDALQNLTGGGTYLKQMYSKFGNWRMALEAYNWGPGHAAAIRENRAPAEVQKYADEILSRAGIKIDAINVHINNPHATPEQIHKAVADGVRAALRRESLNNTLQLGGSYA
jgi:Transglycosylase SLT domain